MHIFKGKFETSKKSARGIMMAKHEKEHFTCGCSKMYFWITVPVWKRW